jgi:hypothetical protein
METTGFRRERTLINNVPNKSRARQKSEGIEQLVDLYKTNLSASTKWQGTVTKALPSHMQHMGE